MKASNTALIIIDMQNDFCVENSKYHLMGYPIGQNIELAGKIEKKLNSFRKKGIIIVHILANYDNYRIKGKPCSFCLQKEQGSASYLKIDKKDKVIVKTTHDGFYNTNLESFLESNNIKNILIAGISTSVCVDSTARSGAIRGYRVTILEDMVASRSKKLHKYSLENFVDNFGFVKKSDSILNKKWI
ncbi:cysteine hydrolase [Candidatus Parcubacteria bacterium]|nr:cysteine hydrolase [Candidatus Parcubacteria bacterium]